MEVPYYQEGDVQGREQDIGGDRVDSLVARVDRVSLHQPEGVKVGPKERFLGGDIEGEDVFHTLERREH